MDSGYVYMLCNSAFNVLYTGSTNNLEKRIRHHKCRLILGFTRKYNVHRLVYFEAHPSIELARAREKQLKRFKRSKKDKLIASLNPLWQDLYLDIRNTTKQTRV